MKIVDTINASQYQHILINVLDRLVDFYITLYVARKSDHEVVSVLTAIRNATESYLVDSGFTQQDLIDINAVLITHDPQPASRADMASEGLPRLHAPIQPTCS